MDPKAAGFVFGRGVAGGAVADGPRGRDGSRGRRGRAVNR
jgi:hypothetical protein